MARADYRYKVQTIDGELVVAIWDLDMGRMSVTNDAEAVIEEIAESLAQPPGIFRWIYRDSDGQWDWLLPDFVSLRPPKVADADFAPGPRGPEAGKFEALFR